MTDREFNKYFREATGFNTMTADWVRSITPDSYNGKIYTFVRLAGKISFLYTIYHQDGSVMKFGRFDTINGVTDNIIQYENTEYKLQGKASALAIKLAEIIFGIGSSDDIRYLLSDAGEFILTADGKKIII